MGFALRSAFRQDDIYLRRPWIAECRPVSAPVFLVEGRIQVAEAIRRIVNVWYENDQVDVVAAVIA